MRLTPDPSPHELVDFRSFLEGATGRLREAVAILDAIDEGNLLSDLPLGPGRARHQCAISLLSLLQRELEFVIACNEAHLGRPSIAARAAAMEEMPHVGV